MLENLFTLFMLLLLQIVLGLDNLLYISLESKNAPENKRNYVQKMGIGLAIVLRILLLFVLIKLIKYFQSSIFILNIKNIIYGDFNIHSIIIYIGGGFILFTSLKEIWHLISFQFIEHNNNKKNKSVGSLIFSIVLMNLVFSFDSTLRQLH